jgi:ferric-dicitrate binding protein FerR (iron transport regulator)
MPIDHQHAEDLFCALMARRLAGAMHAGEAAELDELFQLYPGLRLKADLLDTMFAQERALAPSPEAREAYVRHWLRYRDELQAGPVAEDHQDAAAAATSQSHEAGAGWTDPNVAVSPGRWGKKLRIALGMTAVLSCVFLAIFWMQRVSSAAPVADYPDQATLIQVQNGKREMMTLPDGSRIWLNAGSSLRYDPAGFRSGRRQVALEGEAFFDIAHDRNRPFIVQSRQVRIRVLGTAFNVKAYPGDPDVETSLIRGSVEVTLKDRPDDIYILRPHEKLVVSNGDVQAQSDPYSQADLRTPLVSLRKITVADSGKLIHETAWVDNKLVFRSEDFSTLASRMERHFGVHIHFDNPEQQSLNFTGIFTTETIGQALEAMRLVHPFEYSMDHENVFIK